MDDIIWIVNHSKNSNVTLIYDVISKLDVKATLIEKEAVYKKLQPELPENERPILLLLDPNLPENLIEKIIHWKSELTSKWFGRIQSPVISIVGDSDTIEELQSKWDPTDSKNIDIEDLDQLVKVNIVKKKIENARYNRKAAEFGIIVGEHSKIKQLNDYIYKLKDTLSTVLIQGESGTGKELVARAIHGHGNRKNRSFVPVNVANIPGDLFESIYYGHVKGAFTSATSSHIGHCELAHEGTLFLDEVESMELQHQAKLLRFMEDGQIQKLGGDRIKKVDVRIIAATNEELEDKIKEGKFRKDLFYRLNVVKIETPPLRDHKEDLPLLLKHIMLKMQFKNIKWKPFSNEAIEMFYQFNWPGNVRELENAVERSLTLCSGPTVLKSDLPAYIIKNSEIIYRYHHEVHQTSHSIRDKNTESSNYPISINIYSLKKNLKAINTDPLSIINSIKIPLQICGNKDFRNKDEKWKEKLSSAFKLCGTNVSEAIVVLEKYLNPKEKYLFDPDNDHMDRKRLKVAIELCDMNLQKTSKLLKLLQYECNVSLGFIKSRLDLDKSNPNYVIPELATWFKKMKMKKQSKRQQKQKKVPPYRDPKNRPKKMNKMNIN